MDFVTLISADLIRFYVKSLFLGLLSIHLDNLCGSSTTIKELQFQPPVMGNSEAIETVIICSSSICRLGRKIDQQGLDRYKLNSAVA
jgi:hypothetical protein